MKKTDLEAMQKAWNNYPSQDNEGYQPDRAGFKCGWSAALKWRKTQMPEEPKPESYNPEELIRRSLRHVLLTASDSAFSLYGTCSEIETLGMLDRARIQIETHIKLRILNDRKKEAVVQRTLEETKIKLTDEEIKEIKK